MAEEKVCLLTGAAGPIGQRVAAMLVSEGRKVIALADAGDVFSPDILKNRRIKMTTALPISASSFKKSDVQFCFGDVGDISFLASIFFAAARGGIEIEYVVHLSANALIQKNSPAAYQPDFGATANIVEVTRAYWQSNKDTFKGFFFAAETNKKLDIKSEDMIKRFKAKENFPATIFRGPETLSVAGDYKGRTALSSLYRMISPVASAVKWEKNEPNPEDMYVTSLIRAIRNMIAN